MQLSAEEYPSAEMTIGGAAPIPLSPVPPAAGGELRQRQVPTAAGSSAEPLPFVGLNTNV